MWSPAKTSYYLGGELRSPEGRGSRVPYLPLPGDYHHNELNGTRWL